MAKRILRAFDRYQDAEYNTAVARSRTAKQFEEYMQPDNVRLFPNLKWLPSRSAAPRALHQTFYNRVWAKGDPFWTQNAPGTEWNCKCDLEETDEPVTDNSNVKPPSVPQGLEGNPANTGEVFTDQASYIRSVGNSNTKKRKAEQRCENFARPQLVSSLKAKLINAKTKCQIEGTEQEVMFISQGLEEAAQLMQNTPEYWLKNEILSKLPSYIKRGQYVGKCVSDATHNTRKQTIKLKERTDYFYYIKTTLPDGHDVYLTIGHFMVDYPNPAKADKYYFYTVTKQQPIY